MTALREWISQLALFVFLCPALAHAAELTPGLIQARGYFNRLDYKIAARADAIPEFEAWLYQATPGLLLAAKSDDLGERRQAALTLAYVAMFMVNANYGVVDGKISFTQLTRAERFAAGGSLADEIAARNRVITALLTAASEADTMSRLVDGFLMGARFRESQGVDQSQWTPAGMDGVVTKAEAEPLFHLFSALILAQDYPTTETDRARLDLLVDAMTSPRSPCRGAHPDPLCLPTPLVPFSRQGTGLMLGDSYFQRGLEKKAAHAKGAEGDLIKAAVLYLMISFGDAAPATRVWPLRPVLRQRFWTALGTAFFGKDPSADFWRRPSAFAPYRCASCHSR